MKQQIITRMGDGERVSLSGGEIKDDILAGTYQAAQSAQIPELSTDETEQLFEIMTEPYRIVSVLPGEEVIVTDDGCSMSFYGGQDSSGIGVPLSRMQAILTYERACAADTISMGHSDYSFKPVKPIINLEMNDYYNTSMLTTATFSRMVRTLTRQICCPGEKLAKPGKPRRPQRNNCATIWYSLEKNWTVSAAKASISIPADQQAIPIF
jgi:hypothetical protein